MKSFTGVITSTKMEKSATVEISHTWTHPKYKKTVKKSKKYIVGNDLGAREGDMVLIHETRPMSRLKRFSIVKIIEQAKISAKEATK